MALTDRAILPCGTDLDALAEQVAAEAPPVRPDHQAGCPHCQTALAALRGAAGDLDELGRMPVPVPPALTVRVMTRVRALADAATDHLLLGGPRGHTRISHRLIGRLAGLAASGAPGVRYASGHTAAISPGSPARLRLTVRLVIAFGPSAQAIAAAVRERVARVVPRLTGAELDAVDVIVEDVADGRGSASP